jgi:hypothetical protein
MPRNFVRVWIVYWLAVALLPVYSLYPATFEAFLLQASFVALVLLSFGAMGSLTGVRRMPIAGEKEIANAASIAYAAIVLSFVGFLALAYDKVVVQGIDYSEGVAIAREEWRRLGEEREGEASSIFSVIGYLLGSTYYVAVVLAITQTRSLSSRQRITALIGGFVLMMANSALSGGRSNVLLLAAFALSAFSARRGLRLRSLLGSPTQRLVVKGLVALAAAYTVYIFYERAAAGEDSALEYAIDFLPFLGLQAQPGFRAMLDGSALSSVLAMLVLAVSYVTHSFAVVAAIIDGPSEDKTIVFLHAASILHKLGIVGAPDGDWFLAGRLPSLPGALWHQFGAVGFFLASSALGALAASARAWSAVRPHRLLPLGAYLMLDTTLLLSPALFAGDFLAFPFVVGSFAMLAVWSRLRGASGRRRRATASGSVRIRAST